MKPTNSPQAASAAAASSPKPSTLEKVARVIYESAGPLVPWVKAGEAPKGYYLSLARAALNVIRQVDDETVEAMRQAGIDAASNFTTLGYAGSFKAAIDHILGQQP